ncbi:MAG TPA: hypothetical protein VM715_23105 [Candidatus Acidoferrum sp.]|nr:hypothetical protein [Candidatus Acidoferrum sp.]
MDGRTAGSGMVLLGQCGQTAVCARVTPYLPIRNSAMSDTVVSNTATLHLVVLLQVGTAFVTPTDGQEYDPTDGAVTVPIDIPDAP